MKKITLVAALVGVSYFSNAQVGIGTSSPAESAQLEVFAKDKGILIPNVTLKSTTDTATIAGTEAESLLVYNTASVSDVKPGYYYWSAGKWNRVINQSDLNEATGPSKGDVKYVEVAGEMVFQYFDGTDWQTIDFVDLVQANETKTKIVTINSKQYYVSENYTGTADPTTGVEPGVYVIDVIGGIVNNFNEFITSNVTGGGTNYTTVQEYIEYISKNSMQDSLTKIVYDAITGDVKFQTWDVTTKTWVDVDNTKFKTIVTANESKTTLLEYPAESGKFYYISEATIEANNRVVPTSPFSTGTTLRPGVVYLDVPASVIKNFNTILDGTTTIVKPGTTNQYFTVEEYIQYLSETSDANVGYTVTAIAAADNGGDAIPANSLYYINQTGKKVVIDLSAIVTANETRTTLKRSENGVAYAEVMTDPKAATKITYEYSPERGDKNYIDVTADMIYSITNNKDVQNAITKILNDGGNVYYTETVINAADNHGTDVPAKSLFVIKTVGANQVKTPIDISGTVLQVITNNTQDVKNILGDNFNNTTIVNTGDTWIDGKKIYRGIFESAVTAKTANVSPITLTGTVGNVIDIKILNLSTNQLINTTTTDVKVTGNVLEFKIGTGNMYVVLPEAADTTTNFEIKVIVEYSANITTP